MAPLFPLLADSPILTPQLFDEIPKIKDAAVFGGAAFRTFAEQFIIFAADHSAHPSSIAIPKKYLFPSMVRGSGLFFFQWRLDGGRKISLDDK